MPTSSRVGLLPREANHTRPRGADGKNSAAPYQNVTNSQSAATRRASSSAQRDGQLALEADILARAIDAEVDAVTEVLRRSLPEQRLIRSSGGI